MELTLSICAIIISLISLFWQLINGLKNLQIELNDWYIHTISSNEIHYVFRFAFINKSFNSISISSICLKYGNHVEPLDYAKTTLLFRPITNNGKTIYENRLYSHEIPFRIDGLGVDSGYFGVWNLPDAELLDTEDEIEIIIHTNRGKVKKKVIIPPQIDMLQVKF